MARDDWRALGDDPRASQIESLFAKVKPKLEKDRPTSKGSNEQLVRDLLLNPLFAILGLPWSPAVFYFGKQLDYALLADEATSAKAQELINDGKELDARRLSYGIVEAER
ncbi:MAG: hypothetical protein ACE145_19240 [Terriglobia bacterium]